MLLSIVISALLGGGFCILLWQRRRAHRLIVTHQTVRCPLHHLDATMTVRTDPNALPERRYQEVTACSLLPEQAAAVSTTDGARLQLFAYEGLYTSAEPLPRYSAHVSCGQDCLYTLNGVTEGCHRQQRAHPAGLDASVSLRQQEEVSQRLQRTTLYHSV